MIVIREDDVQVLHGFDSVEHVAAYLESDMFKNDVFVGLKPLWSANPEVRIYTVAKKIERRIVWSVFLFISYFWRAFYDTFRV